jgi:hypothetical protein
VHEVVAVERVIGERPADLLDLVEQAAGAGVVAAVRRPPWQ